MVKSLEKIALRAVCTDVVSSLSSSSSLVATDSENETPPAKKRKLDSAVVVSDLKKKLNEYLVGTHRHFREKLWKEFCIQHIDRASRDNQPKFEICDFLSCVLDNKFCHLKVGSQLNESQDPSPQGGKFYPARVIETIAHNSPTLSSLSFKFLQWQSGPSRASQELFAKSFFNLKNLTHLKITGWGSTSDLTLFFTHLGRSCPNLTSLELGEQDSLQFSLQHLLALVLGEEADILPHSVRQQAQKALSTLYLLQFSNDSVTPICNSLKVLKIHYGRHQVPIAMQVKSTAFLLRHFLQLEIIEVKFYQSGIVSIPCCSIAIQLLHATHQLLNVLTGEEMQENEITREGSKGQFHSLKWINTSPSQATLKLKELELDSATVDLCSRNILEAVDLICPNLEVVRFDEKYYSEGVSSDELIVLLTNKFKKVRSVTFDASCSAENSRAVMASLGGQLLSVKYDCCENTDLAELVSCTELRELEIQYGNVKPTKLTKSIDAETFLPQLRKLHVDCCLGLESRLFENVRPTLVDLYLRCVHLGIPEASKSHWDDVPRLWPQLQSLELWCPSKTLTFDKVRQIIPQMPYIRYLMLPYDTFPPEEEWTAYNDFQNQLRH